MKWFTRATGLLLAPQMLILLISQESNAFSPPLLSPRAHHQAKQQTSLAVAAAEGHEEGPILNRYSR